MSRKTPVGGPTISLFPFLAVLLCTMGALLVVLVLFSRAVRQDAAARSDERQVAVVEELELARDGLAWRRDQLEGVRAKTAEDLAAARMQLAGIEESTRELQDELGRLERTAAALVAGRSGVAVDDATLRELETRLASSRESLDKTRAERNSRPPAYAIVPYAGRNGTHRRPLYIECCGDGVFLQPEGIRLSPADFEGPAGPGNPLACALRAAREQIVATQGGSTDPAAQPYPLLLVRPSGVMAYYAAREAIQSWGSDFGYQLVDEDWTLQFPPADPALQLVEKRAIEESRARLAWLAEVRPVRPAKPPRQYRAAPTRGGVVADGGPSVLGDQSRWDWANSQSGGSGGSANSGSNAGGGTGGGDEPGRSMTVAGTGASGTPGGRTGSGTGRSNGPDAGTRADAGGDAILGGGGAVDGMPHDAGGRYGEGGGSRFTTVGNRAAGGNAFAPQGGRGTGGAAGGAGLAAGAAGPGASAGAGGATAAGQTAAAGGGGTSSGMTSTQPGGAGGGGSGPAMPGLAPSGGQSGGASGGASGASASVSMAGTRGKNWASLATQDRPIPLTRPIRVECALHEFRILDDGGRRVEARVPIDADTAGAIDPLVAAVHRRVEAWGIAGERMYWRPQLVLSETTDGRSRREDLERLLADSGLDTRSRDGRDQIVPLPAIDRTTAVVPSR